MTTNIIQVALALPLQQVFDYYCNHKVSIGTRVLVPFNNRKHIGIVYRLNVTSTIAKENILQIIKVLDDERIINPELFKLCQWINKYYHAPIGEALFLAVPNILCRNTKPSIMRTNYIWHAIGEYIEVKQKLKQAHKQLELWKYIKSFPLGISNTELNYSFQAWHNFAQQLLNKQLLTKEVETSKQPTSDHKKLNLQQQAIVTGVKNNINQFAVHLIYGITGSGKTEVYLQIIADLIKNHQQVLILVPEISLTPQTSQRFKLRFSVDVQIQHSKLNNSERYQVFKNCQAGKTQILIGTRSSVFNQFKNLGLIIIDEEHDASFKQQNNIRYSARDVAIIRAQANNIPIILGSATPSLESILNAKIGKYKFYQINKRAGIAIPPIIKIDDIGMERNTFSQFSLNQIKQTLSKGLQVMVFINRRGFSPALYCMNCGTCLQCPNCNANLTVHKYPPSLICHHCGFSKKIIVRCNECKSNKLIMLGAGTEKIELQLGKLFPEVKTIRIDKDTTSKKQAWQDLYKTINQQDTGILVGTQMLAKGHHFPNVALVIILGVDQSLLSADFRATEHLAQLITQVSGRAGREKHQGMAIIQTRFPKHQLLQQLINNGYLATSESLLQERKISILPPFTRMCVLHCESLIAQNAKDFLIKIKQTIADDKVEVLGPIPAPLEKIAGKFRFQLLIQCQDKKHLQIFLKDWMPKMRKIKLSTKTKLSIDIDPINMS